MLPELIGKNNILTFDECDQCNILFSNFESNFSIFVRPYITLLGVRGKKGVPKFQSRTIDRNEITRTTLLHSENNRRELHLSRLDDYSINPATKTFDIVFRKPPFVPLKVYKALLKIGLSLLPTEYDSFNKKSFLWLTDRLDYLEFIRCAFITTLRGVRFERPSAELAKQRLLSDELIEYPEFVLVLYFANQIIQIFLPFSDKQKESHIPGRNLSLDILPAFGYDKLKNGQKVKIRGYDLGLETSINENHQVSFSYQEAELNIPPN
ncbi:MAG: hypothetical protein IPP56_09650 [Bacteroidetes bacterium]|nr:hypothetical protein [Bacteroidota bacterium]